VPAPVSHQKAMTARRSNRSYGTRAGRIYVRVERGAAYGLPRYAEAAGCRLGFAVCRRRHAVASGSPSPRKERVVRARTAATIGIGETLAVVAARLQAQTDDLVETMLVRMAVSRGCFCPQWSGLLGMPA
jgi:hypothetical protein